MPHLVIQERNKTIFSHFNSVSCFLVTFFESGTAGIETAPCYDNVFLLPLQFGFPACFETKTET